MFRAAAAFARRHPFFFTPVLGFALSFVLVLFLTFGAWLTFELFAAISQSSNRVSFVVTAEAVRRAV